MFKDTREVNWWIIITFVVIGSFLSIFWNWGFQAGLPFFNTLSVNLASSIIVVIGLFFVLGKLKPKDVSLQWLKLFPGIVFTFVLFILQILVILIITHLSTLTVFNNWQAMGARSTINILIGQLLGNTFYEETVFRGFLLTQLYMKFNRGKIFFSILASQTIFALMHIPNRLVRYGGFGLADFVGLFISGLFFCIVFLLTKNLVAVMGFHTLGNVPFLQFSSMDDVRWNETDLLMSALAFSIAIFWHYWRKKSL